MTNELTVQHGRVLEALQELGVAVTSEYGISVKGHDYQLDCWLPDERACIEVDGPSHGMRGRKDKQRDALLDSIGVPTLRLTEKGIRTLAVRQIAVLLGLWLLEIRRDIDERRKMGSENALWN